MPSPISLYITRLITDSGKGTVFDAIDLAVGDNQGKSLDGLWMIAKDRVELSSGVEISRIHSPKHGFLYAINFPVEIYAGILITNLMDFSIARKEEMSFVINDSQGKRLKITNEDIPIVVRGTGFAAVCTSADGGICRGDFFVTGGSETAIRGKVHFDGVETPFPIYLETI